MKNPLLNAPVLFNVAILIISGFVSWFTLTFGLAHLIEGISQINKGSSLDIPSGEYILGWVIVLMLCAVGISSILLTVAAMVAIMKRN